MNQPLISIIIPVYNAAAVLGFCVESIIIQTFKNFEIIILDGLSTDDTPALIDSYAAKHPNILWHSAKDQGIYDAMNKGIEMANGEWIYFMGSDDTLAGSEVLSTVFSSIKPGDEIIYGNCVCMPGQIIERGEWGHLQLLNMNINHQRIFYKIDLFKNRAAFNLLYKVAADYELNIRLFCDSSVTKKYIDTTIAVYHLQGFSAGKTDENFWNDWKKIFVKNFLPFLPAKLVYNRLAWYCWYQLKQRQYKAAFGLFCEIYFHTFSLSFLKHSASQSLKLLLKK